ncbi:right-handed parallel beta-helix repeat-containing protein [Ideonella sp. DXS29W]|uniref:Right-handed parallel beta-helix repeat-containing protein n=1 Tax=Ideonella lacteola TaxID=2984193 RepID=A0ABU9BS40_9BURK
MALPWWKRVMWAAAWWMSGWVALCAWAQPIRDDGARARTTGEAAALVDPSVAVPLALNCAARPSACGYPDATNTGVPVGTKLKRVPQDITSGPGWHYDSRGWITVDTDGADVNGIDTQLSIDVTADHVVIRNSRIRFAGEGWGVGVRHAKKVTIKHCEIGGVDIGSGRMLVAIKDIYADSVNLRVLRNNISMVSTGVQMDAGLIADNYIHDLGYIPGDHLNGTTSNGTSGFLTIRHNTVFNPFDQTDAISLFEDFGVQKDRLIEDNLMAGGGYCLYGGQNAGGPPTSQITVRNNRFARLFYGQCGRFGPVAAWSSGGGNLWTGNIWDDTGAPVNP